MCLPDKNLGEIDFQGCRNGRFGSHFSWVTPTIFVIFVDFRVRKVKSLVFFLWIECKSRFLPITGKNV